TGRARALLDQRATRRDPRLRRLPWHQPRQPGWRTRRAEQRPRAARPAAVVARPFQRHLRRRLRQPVSWTRTAWPALRRDLRRRLRHFVGWARAARPALMPMRAAHRGLASETEAIAERLEHGAHEAHGATRFETGSNPGDAVEHLS